MTAAPYILVIEDSRTQALLLRHLLLNSQAPAGRRRVEVAASAEEGLARVRAEAPSLVISDNVLPGLSGLQLCRELRADPALRTIPFVLLTAQEGENLAPVPAGGDGPDAVLRKPMGEAQVRDLLKTHCPGGAVG